MNFNLNAHEEVCLEIKGKVSPNEYLKKKLPAGVELVLTDGLARIALRQAKVERLNWHAFPYYRVHCDVAIWAVEVMHAGRKGWYAIETNMNHAILRSAANMVFSILIRDAEFSFMEKRKSLITTEQLTCGGELKLHVELGQEAVTITHATPIFLSGKNRVAGVDVVYRSVDFCRISKADVIKDEVSRKVAGDEVKWDTDCYVLRGHDLEWMEA